MKSRNKVATRNRNSTRNSSNDTNLTGEELADAQNIKHILLLGLTAVLAWTVAKMFTFKVAAPVLVDSQCPAYLDAILTDNLPTTSPTITPTHIKQIKGIINGIELARYEDEYARFVASDPKFEQIIAGDPTLILRGRFIRSIYSAADQRAAGQTTAPNNGPRAASKPSF